MDSTEYLNKILESQCIESDSDEMKVLRQHRADVEDLIKGIHSKPTIKYGGSKAKGTMIRESYDLDIICYFSRDDDTVGITLEEIYNNVRDVFAKDYYVEPKGSAIRLRGKSTEEYKVDFHIDVVPGRFPICL